jgi:DNA-binding response OmpR family regulator
MAQVLLVQGDAELGGLLGCALRQAGHSVFLANDAATGLQHLAGAPIDLILVGPSLPDLPVEDCCRRARAQTSAPIVALVGRMTRHGSAPAARGAADAYLALTLPPQTLLSQLSGLLALAQRR